MAFPIAAKLIARWDRRAHDARAAWNWRGTTGIDRPGPAMSQVDQPARVASRRGLRSLWGALDRSRRDPSLPPQGPPAESLFGALVGGDSLVHDSQNHAGAGAEASIPSRHPGGDTVGRASTGPSESASVPSKPTDGREAEANGATALDDESSARRLYRVFVGARAVLGAALVAALVAGGMFGMRAPLGLMLIAMGYAAQAVVLWMLPRFRQESAFSERLTRSQWAWTIGVDLFTFSLMHTMQPALNFNFVALLLLPVLMGGLLASRTAALAGTSAVVLFVLGVTWHTVESGSSAATAWMQAGLAGAGFFAATLLAGEMASRLASQARAARSGLELARQQAQLNRLVIEEMADGVLVVDRRGRVRAANPAARRLLVREGLGRPAPFHLQDDGAWSELQHWLQQAFARMAGTSSEASVTLKFSDGLTRTLRVRARFTRRGSRGWRASHPQGLPSETYGVLFLEDQRHILDRNRQEKLAAMGRVSAGIAHEIRNPLAAIAQANALLAEEAQGSEQRMLTRMVGENVERLKLIVDDVMAVAPGHVDADQRIDAVATVARLVSEWARAADLPVGRGTRLQVELCRGPVTVEFDAEHLRRVLVNLLDNARRHATAEPGAIVVKLTGVSREHAMLSVASDGEPIGADIEPYLFEPFFSTRSRGTGLGLYICRELCERYGATIDYWKQPSTQRHRNEFRVVFRTSVSSEPNANGQPS